MGKLVNAALYYAKNLPEVKVMVEGVEGSGPTQAKVSLQTTGLLHIF